MTSVRASRFAVGPMVVLALAFVATVAVAQPQGFDGTVVVEADEALTVAEQDTIHGSLVIMGGRAHVLGRVEGDLVVVDGRATLGPTARIDGDALTVRGTIERNDLAQVVGEEKKLSAAQFAQVMARLSEALESEEPAEERAEAETEAPPEEPAEPETETPAEAAGEEPAEPEPAEAPEGEEPETAQPEQHEVRGDLSGYGQLIEVPKDEIRIGSIASFGGPININGTVRGDVASFGGRVTIGGEVEGQIATFGAPVRLEPNSRVTGDIATLGASVHKEPGAIHEGRVAGFGGMLPGLPRAPTAGSEKAEEDAGGVWVAGTVFGGLLALVVAGLFPNATRNVADNIARRPGAAFAHGGLTLLLLAPVCLILAITCVGVVLVPFVGLGVLGAFLLGLVGLDLLVGRQVVASTRLRIASALGLAVLGVAVFRVAALLGLALQGVGLPLLTPVLGFVAGGAWLALIAFGIGGALMTGFGTRADGEWITRRFRGPEAAIEGAMDDVEQETADEDQEGA